jgi:iron-sulfur cluster assembly protein
MITLSDTARARLAGILKARGRPNAGLRLHVAEDGCSGLSYRMRLEDEPAADDYVIEDAGVKVIVDPSSAQHVQGSRIDFVDALMGGGFVVLNPNAVKSCGCGHSFNTRASAGSPRPCH